MLTTTRRSMMGIAASGSALLLACASSLPARDQKKGESKSGEEEVSPGEDLMREHGVLRRVLFIYDEAIARLESGAVVQPEVVAAGASFIRKVIEDYHEQLEERFIFPRMEAAHREVELVGVLRRQHAAGRRLTESIQEQLKGALRESGERKRLADALRSFARMYRPHAAREDTVLFPSFHSLIGERAYRELGDQFEDEEHRQLGSSGFEGAVAEVDRLESAYGLHDLSKFTP